MNRAVDHRDDGPAVFGGGTIRKMTRRAVVDMSNGWYFVLRLRRATPPEVG